MKKIFFVLITPCILIACSSQGDSKRTQSEVNKALYERAVELEDDMTAIVALNYLLLEDSDNLEYTDSLSRLYLRNRILSSGLEMAQKVLKAQPENNKTLELVSEAQMALGKYPEAIENLKSLHKKVGDIRYLYQLAIVHSEMNNMEAFDQRLDQILIDPNTAMVEFPASQGMQEVDMKAAANFLKAQLNYGSGNLDLALSYVKKALTISPNFQSALVAFEQIQQDKKSPAAKGPQKLSAKQLEELRYKQFLEQQRK
jgi:tetratricopeptide (TPR) repeat protein